MENIRRGDYHHLVTVGGLADKAVRSMGGYQQLGMTHSDQLSWTQKRFTEAYNTLQAAEESRAVLRIEQLPTVDINPNVQIRLSALAKSKKL